MPTNANSTTKSASNFARPLTLYEWLNWLNHHTSAAVALLVVVNLACHWQTLGGYFLADDFVHVAYLKEVFQGHPEFLLKNFYSTWLQTEGTNFYRPFISLTLALDWLLSGSSPMGYHITNFIYQCLSTVGLYLVVKECTFVFQRSNGEDAALEGVFDLNRVCTSTILPLMAALLFAVHPLHSEVVGWIIARVDSVCCAFYLLSMWLFLKARRTTEAKNRGRLQILSFVFFVVSLISKEMAVTLPPTLVLFMVLFPEQNSSAEKTGFVQVLKRALLNTWQLWLILLVYAVIRTLALGSVTGGYQGSIGEGLSSSTLERIFSTASLQRIVFPINAEVFSPLKRLVRPLAVLYAITALLFFARVLSKQGALIFKVIAFAALWFLIVMAPTIPVWNLTESLQGSRFIYMGTAPLCLLIAAFLTPMWKVDALAPGPARAPLNGASALAAIAVVVFYGVIVFGNNSAWVHAGAELRSLRDALDAKVRELPQSQRLALLNLPHKYKGAHMLYNAATLSVLLAPPLNQNDIVSRVSTFEPVLFGDDDLIRISRIRKMIAPGSGINFVYWDRDKQKLNPINLELAQREIKLDDTCQSLTPIDIDARGNPIQKPTGEASNKGVLPANTRMSPPYSTYPAKFVVQNNLQLLTPALDIEPCAVDFLDICLSARKNDSGTTDGASANTAVPVVVQWTGATSSGFTSPDNLITTISTNGKIYRMRIHVSEHKKWLSRGKIHRVSILCPAPDASITVHGLSLLNGSHAIPTLDCVGKNFAEDESGVVRAGGKTGRFTYDASAIEGAQSVLFEISKPDAWFEHYSNTYRDSERCPRALKSWTAKGLHENEQDFSLRDLAGPGFYEIRTAAVGQKGEVVGYFSDPIMFQLSH